MTELKRLEISGIRIFKEDEPQIIDFEPITLIVGANGTGKSTLIESLKFATIGRLQREMITLPDIWDKEKIESKILLNFQSFDQNNYEIMLSPSISKLPNNRLTFQTGNCNVTVRTPENRLKYLNFTPTEIEKRIPKYFGVSPSIIENVIFCDQKQSCWPIDDKPPVLKQKFDQFFNTDKYNDAIESLNETKKNLNKKLNENKLEIAKQEQRIRSYKEHKEKKIELEKKISFLNQEIGQKQAHFDENSSKIEEYEIIKPRVEEIRKKIKKKKFEYETQSNYIQDLFSKIQDLQPKESLLSTIEYNLSDITSNKEKIEFTERLLKMQNESKNNLEKEKNSISEKVEEIQRSLEEIQSTREIYKHCMNEFVERYKTDDYESILTSKGQILSQEQKSFDEIKTQRKNCIDQKDIEINELKVNYGIENDKFSNLKNLINENKQELTRIGRFDETKLNEAEEIKNKAIKKLDDFLNSSKSLQEIEEEINNQKTNLTEIEEKQKALRIEKEKCQEIEKNLEKLSFSNDQIEQSNAIIQLQLNTIKNVLGDQSIEEESAEQILNESIQNLKNQNNSIRVTNFQLNKNLNEITARIETNKHYLDENEKEIQDAKETIQKVLHSDDINFYFDELEKNEKNLKKENNELAKLKNSESVYTDFIEKAHNHCCPLCGQHFSTNEGFNEFIEKMKNFISSIPNKIENCENEIENCEKRINELKNVSDDIRIYQQNEEKKAKFNDQIQKDSAEEENLRSQINSITQQIELNDKKLDEIRDLKENIFLLNQALKQLKEAEIRKNEISPKIDQNSPSIDEIQFKEVQLHEEYSSIISNLNELIKNGNQYSIQKSSLEKESDKAIQKFNEVKSKFERKIELDNKIDEIQTAIDTKKRNIDEMNDKIIELNNDRHDIEIFYSKQIEEQEKKCDEARISFQSCSSLIKQIKKSKDKLNEVDPNDMSKQLEDLKIQLEQKKEEFKKMSEKVLRQNQMYDLYIKETESLEKVKDDLLLQKDYFIRLEKFEIVKNELKTLKFLKYKELGELRKIEYEDLKSETQLIEKDLIKLKTQKESFENQFEDENLLMSDYESSFLLFNEAQIQISLIEKSKTDIERYTKELNRIILEFHSNKMNEINDLIYNYWQSTYYGRDVDTIRIKCEKESDKKVDGFTKVQYNYKVVMIKNNIEMDMSKCASAGQRMLASIIIRLALAKTFALNCGIIAFDEPTTNVDKDNIKSFAKELIGLFKSSNDSDSFSDDIDSDIDFGQKHLQIIIISHDANFVQMLNEEGILDNFYQIESNTDGTQAYSQIIRKKMNESF